MKKTALLAFAAFCLLLQECKKDEVVAEDVKAQGLFIGVVGFNSDVKITTMSNNITATNAAIDDLTNTVDQTALCYGISKGVDELTRFSSGQPLDQAFVVAFTDGYDNYSGKYFPSVGQGAVVSYTQNILKNTTISNKPIKTYTVGFVGKGNIVESDLRALAVNGQYTQATSSSLNNTFQDIAQSLLATSANFSILTSNTSINANAPKEFRITFNTYANPSYTGAMTPYTIAAQFTNQGGNAPTFKITSSKVNYISFVGDNGAAITGTVEGSKYNVPLANLTINSPLTGQSLFIKSIEVTNRFGTNPFTVDPEDSKAVSAIAKNVGVVLVLDCSTSLQEVFPSLKQSSKDFVQKMADGKR